MGEHKRPPRPSVAAETLAKEIAREILLGTESRWSIDEIERQSANEVVFSVTFDQVWRPIKTALLAADRGVIRDIEVVGESMPISGRPS